MSWWRKAGGFGAYLLIAVVGLLVEKGVDAIIDAIRRRERKKNNEALDTKIDEAFQDLKNKMEALQENFKKLQSKQSGEIRAQLEKIPEEEIAMALESKLKMNFRELFRRIQTVEEDVKKWPETIKYELQLFRAELEKNPGNKEEEIARALESKLNKNVWELLRRIQTLEEDVKEWPESTRDELQLLRAALKKIPENKEEEIAMALGSKLKKNRAKPFLKIQTWADDVNQRLEDTKDELRLRRAELEKNKGN